MGATQGIKINESVVDFFKMMMDFDNESQEYRDVTERGFKEAVEVALQSETIATLKIKWIKR